MPLEPSRIPMAVLCLPQPYTILSLRVSPVVLSSKALYVARLECHHASSMGSVRWIMFIMRLCASTNAGDTATISTYIGMSTHDDGCIQVNRESNTKFMVDEMVESHPMSSASDALPMMMAMMTIDSCCSVVLIACRIWCDTHG